jgi:hypothetical protein
MSSSAHDHFFTRFFRRKRPPSPTDWQRERREETPAAGRRETNTEGLPMQDRQPRSYPLHQREPEQRPFLEWHRRHPVEPRPLARKPLDEPMVMPREQFARLPTSHPHPVLRRWRIEPIQDDPPGFSMGQPAWLTAVIHETRQEAARKGNAPPEQCRPSSPDPDAWLARVARLEVWGEPEMPPQTTGALEELAHLATLRHNSDTLEVPTVMKQRQEQKRNVQESDHRD